MVIFEAQQKIDVLEKVRSTEPKAGNGQKSKQDRPERNTEARERKRGRWERERERLGIG